MPDFPPPSLPPASRASLPPTSVRPPDTVRFAAFEDDDDVPDTVRMSAPLSVREPDSMRVPTAPPSSRVSEPPASRLSRPPASRASVPPPAALALAAATLVPGCAVDARSEAPPPIEGQAVTLAQLDVTSGTVVERGAPTHLVSGSGMMRAIAPRTSGDGAELRFTYRGETEARTKLADGESRTQLGLKLRAADECNLVYVMWRVDDEQRLVVSVKRNPGKHTHEECGADGYTSIAPAWSAPLPRVDRGEAHALRAEIAQGRLLVTVDGRAVWEGALPESALSIDGPIGVRTDNAALEMELVPVKTLPPALGASGPPAPRARQRSTILPAIAGTVTGSGVPPPRRP